MVKLHPPSKTPRLPTELLEMIVDIVGEVAEEDPEGRSALLACNLASRAFCHFSRRHLFRRIKVADTNGVRKYPVHVLAEFLHGVHTLLVSHPRGRLPSLAKYVQEFILDALHSNIQHLFLQLGRHDLLADIFESLQGPDYGIQSLTLLFNSSVPSWVFLSGRLRSTLLGLIRAPRLKYLNCLGLLDLPQEFLHGARLKHLVLHGCTENTLSKTSDVLPRESQALPQLEILDTDFQVSLSAFERMGQSATKSAFGNLRELSGYLTDHLTFERCMAVIRRSNTTLESLHLRYDGISFLSYPSLHISDSVVS